MGELPEGPPAFFEFDSELQAPGELESNRTFHALVTCLQPPPSGGRRSHRCRVLLRDDRRRPEEVREATFIVDHIWSLEEKRAGS